MTISASNPIIKVGGMNYISGTDLKEWSDISFRNRMVYLILCCIWILIAVPTATTGMVIAIPFIMLTMLKCLGNSFIIDLIKTMNWSDLDNKQKMAYLVGCCLWGLVAIPIALIGIVIAVPLGKVSVSYKMSKITSFGHKHF